ncbi:MAG: hypothetical protein ABR587_15920, partial [Candidatus Binatia bacterium]
VRERPTVKASARLTSRANHDDRRQTGRPFTTVHAIERMRDGIAEPARIDARDARWRFAQFRNRLTEAATAGATEAHTALKKI